MFRQMAKRRGFLDQAKGEKKPKAVIAIGIGVPKGGEGGIGPGEETDALAGDENQFRTNRQKKAAILADHHQQLADEFRAKAEAAKGNAEPGEGNEETAMEEALETPEEEALEGPEGEAAEEHVGLGPEDEELEDELAAPKNGGDLRNTRKGLPLSKVKKGY